MPFFSRLLATAAPLALAATAVHADVVISTAATQNMTCGAGVCAPTAADAVLNVADLEVLLASGATAVTTTGAGVQANNIVSRSALTWTSANTLSLSAYRSIAIYDPVSVDGSAGLNIVTSRGRRGALTFGKKGKVIFSSLSSVLSINGAPYKLVGDIKTLASAITSKPGGKFALAADYDASGDGIYRSSPIDTVFSGVFEGLGNAVENLEINDPNVEHVGLFATLNRGRIENVSVPRANVMATNGNIGGGYAVGVLLGYDNGTVAGSNASGTVSVETAYVGGLIGFVGPQGHVSSSHSLVAVTVSGRDGNANGGLVGWNQGSIKQSYATGSVAGGGSLGGLVGYNEGTITTSFASGSVGDGMYCGGLVGQSIKGDIIDTYATGGVTCASENALAGGFASFNANTLSQSYSIGSVEGYYEGGFLGENEGSTSSDYWDTTSSCSCQGVAEGNSTGVNGLTTQQLQAELPSGFSTKIWAENSKINNGFPYLIANPPPK